jgi:hypothetical protein
VAVTVVTEVLFSEIEKLLVDVIAGMLSLTALTVIITSCVTASAPSETCTVAL